MKNIYLSMVMLLTFAIATAQVTPTFHSNGDLELNPVSKANIFNAKSANTKGASTLWFHTPSATSQLLYGDGPSAFADYYAFSVFPDTTMLRGGNGEIMFIHSAAVTIDPASEIFGNDAAEWNANTAMSMDSVGVGYLYIRNTSNSIVDTLVMQVQVNNWGYTVKAADYSWVQSIYGVSQMYVPAILHASLTWDASGNADASVLKTIKFPLNISDTSSMGAYLENAVSGVSLAAGEFAKVSFTFVPGYTWTANVDSIQMYNKFSFLSFGDASIGNFPHYEANDYNSSQGLRAWAYRDATDATYEPAYFFVTNPWYYQYHDIYFQYTALNTGIESNISNMSVSQNRPNPFNGTTAIDYNLDKAANVSLNVYNVAGAQIMSITEGLKTAGTHTITIDGSDLQAGVYYYTLTADNYSVTKKMIVY